MVNITDDIWTAEPALRPEDEIVLRKLHDMLQSTADDLKLLSGELSKYHEPGVQVKSLPTPLDEEFNEKVHIEELVNAKFHGYKVVDKPQPTPAYTQRSKIDGFIKSKATESQKKKVIDAGIQVNKAPVVKKAAKKNNLTVSGTKTIQINENNNKTMNSNTEYIGQQKEKTNKPIIGYKEISFTYTQPKIDETPLKSLQVQNMPSINIRGELKEQKVLNLNIEPVNVNCVENDGGRSNVTVISVQHDSSTNKRNVPTTNTNLLQYPIVPTAPPRIEPMRKFSKMSSCESSEVDSCTKIDMRSRAFSKIKPPRTIQLKPSPKQQSENNRTKKNIANKKELLKNSKSNLDVWKKKLNAVYGLSTSSKKSKLLKPEMKARRIEYKTSYDSKPFKNLNNLNNAEYIPYSKLTLGGVRVSDIEKELSDAPNSNDITPILNKILSRENSFHNESPRINTCEDSPRILTTSDENLLREVLDIEKTVNKTLTNDGSKKNTKDQSLNDMNDQESYADDFEEEKSEYTAQTQKPTQIGNDSHSDDIVSVRSSGSYTDDDSFKNSSKKDIRNKINAKPLNLAFKENVEIFEYVHNIVTQETGTQSNGAQKISLKQTQTSPRNEKLNVQPIHNDLWSSIDPKREVEKLFQLEKDFIKKLIIDEYGDLLEKNFNKPSTSKDSSNVEKNITASQKNTQTSPAHVKSVMTSPTRTKTRMTSPLALSLTVDQQTSIMRDELKIDIEDGNDLALSINLSSPRFSLRLPQTSREVISNLESHAQSKVNEKNINAKEARVVRMFKASSSSSADGDYSSSDISSLGEVGVKIKRRLRKLHIPSISELSSSVSSQYGSDFSNTIYPLRSEGEISLGQVNRRNHNKNNKSEGETSVGRIY